MEDLFQKVQRTSTNQQEKDNAIEERAKAMNRHSQKENSGWPVDRRDEAQIHHSRHAN